MTRLFTVLTTCSLAAAVMLTAGCQRDEVVEYTAPKESFPAVSSIQQQLREAHASLGIPHDHAHGEAPPHGHPPAPPAAELQFTAPEGWEARPLSAMRKASFLVTAETGAFVDISVMSFPGETGGVHANVNRWREQLGLPPLEREALEQTITSKTLPSGDYLLVDIGAPEAASPPAQRIIGAIHSRGAETWFFKMMGEDALTAAQREPFLGFLQSVRYE